MRTIIVKNLKKEHTVLSYLKYVFPSITTATIFKAFRNKDIRINQIKISNNQIVKPGDQLTLYILDKFLYQLPDHLDVIYEDSFIYCVFKPQGILSNREEKNPEQEMLQGGIEPTLEDLVTEQNPDYKICHRLDRNTSGIILFAKNDIAYQEILKAFQEGFIQKEYIAYVAGTKFTKNHEVLEKYIVKNQDGYSKIYDTPVKNSKKIITSYQVETIYPKQQYAILRVKIHTGKTHQIRAQLANIGHPIIGDPKYGKNEINRKFKTYKQLLFAINYRFSFPIASPLFYLNEIAISLDKTYYENKIKY